MGIFADFDVRADWWDQAACNTGTGGLAGLFFPDPPGSVPVEPGPGAGGDVWAAYEQAWDVYFAELAVTAARTEKAMDICAGCPFTGKGGVCYSAAVARRETSGIWGGVELNVTKVRRARVAAGLGRVAA